MSKEEARETRSGLADLRRTIAAELRDPWGKVNSYVGCVLLVLLLLILLRYFANSIALKIDLGFMSADLSASGWREFWMFIAMLLVTVGYWVFCLKTFAQLAPLRHTGHEGEEEVDGE